MVECLGAAPRCFQCLLLRRTSLSGCWHRLWEDGEEKNQPENKEGQSCLLWPPGAVETWFYSQSNILVSSMEEKVTETEDAAFILYLALVASSGVIDFAVCAHTFRSEMLMSSEFWTSNFLAHVLSCKLIPLSMQMPFSRSKGSVNPCQKPCQISTQLKSSASD